MPALRGGAATDRPRFRRYLLGSEICRALLLGHNTAQRILILTGTANGGKSTLVDIFEEIIGKRNVGELRTEHLDTRFEIGRFIGRTVLTGKDVEGQFLQTPGAHSLKKLVGHDLLDAELKTSNGKFQVKGDYGVIITCNSRLRVRLDGDADAWRRRLLMVKYERPKPERRISAPCMSCLRMTS